MIKNDYLINGTGNMLYDSVHLLSTGQIALATLWVNAYNRILVEPLTLIHNWTGENSDTYVLGSATGLGYSVDKDFVWFDVTGNNFANVLVDDVIVNTDDYTVKNDSTIITLLPTYLNTLQT
ncbi:MAG: hypothetical protein LBP53_01365 [Candidatus Peribacteria bacterium]|jgi:hypothetical protein|nr:hypothetical protein [Candidatus Peribacteria bacterium]